MLRDGLVHNVASDAHDLIRRPPGVDAVLAAEGMSDGADWFTRQVPEAILAGTPVPTAPPMTLPAQQRNGFLGRLLRRA